MKIAIVGAGMAGMGTLRYYIDHVREEFEIVVYGDPATAGTGYPFGEDDEALLLNQRLREMTLAPWDNKQEYVQYLEEYSPEQLEQDFISRPEFGEYTSDLFRWYVSDPRVTFIPQVVTDLDVVGEQVIIHTMDSKDVFDIVHLCIGQLPQTDIYELNHLEGYIGNPFPIESHQDLLLHAQSVGIIGTSLTSLDIIMYLQTHGYNNKIVVTSRAGTLPFIRGHKTEVQVVADRLLLEKEHPTPDDFIQAVYEETKRHALDFDLLYQLNDMSPLDSLTYQLTILEELGKIQAIVDELMITLRKVWNQFKLKDQQQFLKKYKGIFTQLFGPFPEQTARRIISMIEKGQLIYLRGVSDITYADQAFQIKTEQGNEKTEVMVSAVGPNKTGEQLANENHASPLVKRLLQKGILTLHPLGGIAITYPEFSIVTRTGVVDRLKLYGSLVSTTHFNNSGVGLIVSEIPYTVDQIVTTTVEEKVD